MGYEQQPIYKIFNAKINPVPEWKKPQRSGQTYSKDNGRIR